eukprot:SAG31_NODE_34_length_31842_cov_31.677850_16_plen_118_part_00
MSTCIGFVLCWACLVGITTGNATLPLVLQVVCSRRFGRRSPTRLFSRNLDSRSPVRAEDGHNAPYTKVHHHRRSRAQTNVAQRYRAPKHDEPRSIAAVWRSREPILRGQLLISRLKA